LIVQKRPGWPGQKLANAAWSTQDNAEFGASMVNKYALSIKREVLRQEVKRIAEDLRAAESAKDGSRGLDLLAEHARLKRELESIGAV